MFIVLFVLWIILNGRITLEIAIFGAVICGALYLFLYKFMEYSPNREPEPVLVRFKTGIRTQTGQTVLANSITLTPGTITADLEEGNYIVHSLDREYAVGIHESGFVEKLVELEAAAEGGGKGDVS